MRLVQIGSVIVDIVLGVPSPPGQGEDVLATSATLTVGGGLNILSAARRQGMDAAYGGRRGTGQFGQMVAAALAEEGVETLLDPATGDTGFCVVMVDATGERTMVTTMGVEAHLSSADLASIELRDDDLVYVSGYDLAYPHGEAIADWVHGDVLFDPGPLVAEIAPDVLAKVLEHTAWISLNAREAMLLAGSEDPADVLRAHMRGAIVRTGADGCRLATHDGSEHIPAFPASPIDTTGAGDAHVGAFAAALARGESPARACRYANAAASVVVATWGPATAPPLEVTERRLSH